MEGIGSSKESTIKDFLNVVFRRKWIIIGIVAVTTITVVILNMKEPAAYESSATLLVKRGEVMGVFTRGVRTLTWEEEIASQIELVKSKVVIDQAQELLPRYFPAGYETARRLNLGAVNSGVITTSNVIWITYVSQDPVFCEVAVNAIANAYKEYYVKTRTPPEMEDFFLQELRDIKEEIEYWRDRKQNAQSEWHLVDLKEQKQSDLARLNKYLNDLDEVSQDRKVKEAVIQRLEDLKDSEMDGVSAVSSELTNSSLEIAIVKELRLRLQNLKIEESKLKTQFTGDHPDLKRVRNQIKDVNAMIGGEIETQLLVNRNQLEILIEREEMIRDMAGQLRLETYSYPEKEVELNRADDALAHLLSREKELMREHLTARVSIASNPEWTVTVINPATKAYRKKTRDYVRMALGPVFSFFVAMGFAFFIDNLDHSIKNVVEAEDTLGVAVLASFPDMEEK